MNVPLLGKVLPQTGPVSTIQPATMAEVLQYGTGRYTAVSEGDAQALQFLAEIANGGN
jgi:hypothetical protein